MSKINHFKYYKIRPQIIKLAIMYYVRFPLSLRNVADILHERGIDICHETIRYWWNKLGPIPAKELKAKLRHQPSKWRWHMDEVFVKINGETHYLWRAIDHEGTVVECYVSKKKNKRAAMEFLRKSLKRYEPLRQIVTDKLGLYKAALRETNMEHLQLTKRYTNKLIENSHLHFRQREKIMCKLRLERSLQKFISIQSNFQNHFNHQRYIETRSTFKNLRQS